MMTEVTLLVFYLAFVPHSPCFTYIQKERSTPNPENKSRDKYHRRRNITRASFLLLSYVSLLFSKQSSITASNHGSSTSIPPIIVSDTDSVIFLVTRCNPQAQGIQRQQGIKHSSSNYSHHHHHYTITSQCTSQTHRCIQQARD